jgi:hypothetical protein
MRKMETPLTRAEFERRFNIFKELVLSGRMIHPNSSEMNDSILKINILPNKRIDLLTIDEIARVTVNTMANVPSPEDKEY